MTPCTDHSLGRAPGTVSVRSRDAQGPRASPTVLPGKEPLPGRAPCTGPSAAARTAWAQQVWRVAPCPSSTQRCDRGARVCPLPAAATASPPPHPGRGLSQSHHPFSEGDLGGDADPWSGICTGVTFPQGEGHTKAETVVSQNHVSPHPPRSPEHVTARPALSVRGSA